MNPGTVLPPLNFNGIQTTPIGQDSVRYEQPVPDNVPFLKKSLWAVVHGNRLDLASSASLRKITSIEQCLGVAHNERIGDYLVINKQAYAQALVKRNADAGFPKTEFQAQATYVNQHGILEMPYTLAELALFACGAVVPPVPAPEKYVCKD